LHAGRLSIIYKGLMLLSSVVRTRLQRLARAAARLNVHQRGMGTFGWTAVVAMRKPEVVT
jgi:hypothetical protein